jgi:hypothetical protein
LEERLGWLSKVLLPSSWGNNKDPDYVTFVANMQEKFSLGVLKEINIYFLNSHLDIFSQKSWCIEQGARRTFPPRH